MLEHFEEESGGLQGVEGAEFRRELEGGGLGRDGFERFEDRCGRHLGSAGTDEDVVDRIDGQQDARVADEAGGGDFIAVAAEDGADEGAEVGGAIDNEDTVTGLVVGVRRCGLAKEGQDGILFVRVGVDDGVKESDLEDFVDEGGRRGKADVAGALAEVGGVADDEADSGAVDASDGGDIEHDALEFADDFIERSFEVVQLVAEDDVAGALQDEDVAAEALFDLEGHRVLGRVRCEGITGV